MPLSHQLIRLPVLPSTKRRMASPRTTALAPGGRLRRRQRIQASPASAFRHRYARLVAVIAAGVLLINGLVLFSILRDQAHLSQPSRIGTPLHP